MTRIISRCTRLVSKRTIGIGAGIVVLAVAGILFGVTAIRLIAGMVLLYFLPSYLILRSFDLEEDERIFLSFFLGFGLFSVVVFYMNKILPSLRWSIALTFFLALATGIILNLVKQKKQH